MTDNISSPPAHKLTCFAPAGIGIFGDLGFFMVHAWHNDVRGTRRGLIWRVPGTNHKGVISSTGALETLLTNKGVTIA
jgi:hypothetical protein